MNIICKKCNEAYPNSSSTDFTSTDNSLNRFVAYHIVDGKFYFNNLVTKTEEGRNSQYRRGFSLYAPIDTWRYYCSKGPNRDLLKITHVIKDGTTRINRKSFYNNAFDGDYQETSCPIQGICISGDTAMYGTNYARNGYYYALDNILLYNDDTKYGVLNERIRYDVAHYLPELSSLEYYRKNRSILIPWNYFQNLIGDDSAPFLYFMEPFAYEYDEFVLNLPAGEKSFTMKLMPVPFAGNWQVRIDYCIDNRIHSYDDVYFGSAPNVNQMEHLHIDPDIFNEKNLLKLYTYKQDIVLDNDSISCKENDKQLFLQHLMKGPKGIPLASSGTYRVYIKKAGELVSREFVQNITYRDLSHKYRVILYEGYMEPNKTYYLKITHKTDFSEIAPWKYTNAHNLLDYMELVPESVYDNPDRTEDIW